VKELLQEITAFLWHVIDAPETAPETKEAAEELAEKVVSAINSPEQGGKCPEEGMSVE
jgi:hypothetical protein